MEQRQLERGYYPKQIWDTFASDPQQVHLADNGSEFEIGIIDAPLTSDPTSNLADVLLDPAKRLVV